jgi:hypothetical protein
MFAYAASLSRFMRACGHSLPMGLHLTRRSPSRSSPPGHPLQDGWHFCFYGHLLGRSNNTEFDVSRLVQHLVAQYARSLQHGPDTWHVLLRRPALRRIVEYMKTRQTCCYTFMR